MSKKLGKAAAFRQWLENQEQLEKAEKRMDLNKSEIINRSLAKAMHDVIREMRECFGCDLTLSDTIELLLLILHNHHRG